MAREYALEDAGREDRFVAGTHFQQGVVSLDGLLIFVKEAGEAMPGSIGGRVVGKLCVHELSELDGAIAVGLANAVQLLGLGVLDERGGTEVSAEGEHAGERGFAARCLAGAGHVFAQNRGLEWRIRDLIVVDQPQVHVGHIRGIILRRSQTASPFQKQDDSLLAGLDLVLILRAVLLQVQRAGHLNERGHLAIFKGLELERILGHEPGQLELVRLF